MSIIAKGQKATDYEKVAIDVFINGTIAEVQAKLGVKKEYRNQQTGLMETREVDMCRFKFELEGYKYPHYSRWNTLSLHEKSNLYNNYIVALFGAKYSPGVDLDIEKLTGAKVKVRWDETILKNGSSFQFVDKIRFRDPEDAKRIDLLLREEEAENANDMEGDMESKEADDEYYYTEANGNNC